MKNAAVFLLTFVLGAAAVQAVAQAPSVKAAAPKAAAGKGGLMPKRDASAPVNIAADKMLADLNAKTVTYTGNVVVVQGDIRMHANIMKVNTNNGQADKIFADGNVVVEPPASGTATGDNGIYLVGPRTVTLNGHVVLKRAKDVMRGTQLTVNLVTGQAQLGAKGAPPAAPGLQGGRVVGVFTPPPENNSAAPATPPGGTP